MATKDYRELLDHELINYYLWVRSYIEKGFRVDGLKEELQLIHDEMKRRSIGDETVDEKAVYLKEIRHYIRTIRL
ncbi:MULTISPECIES: hypothetical protein [Bacillaceae]|uniref:Uncharacterized protein n=1 Tax=Evansella alkalicola TaxID=745819 RepID=A0ABS6JTI1_9BACI|nr:MULTISPECIES: hypothetical protein [Bacillaceae]MBU9721381.1 hypothetical protein [Bacillus alkalicola]